ncbi:MAG: zinc-binding dehydrogenase [Sphingomonadaceae bacterium]
MNSNLQLHSLVNNNGTLQLSLVRVEMSEPGPDHVVVEMHAAPINPSDLGLLVGAADMSTAVGSTNENGPVITATIPEAYMRAMAGRLDESMAVGNEGAGIVVKAGSSPAAQALMGKLVTLIGGETYAQYKLARVSDCMVLPEGTTPAEGASCFVNPLTSLAMTEVMRREGHTALVHTAAASNLGQMLNKICIKDGIDLVNIVRSDAQAAILRDIGATYICDSSAPTFMDDLTEALAATGATIAFDAIGGGKLANQILTAMEAAANRNAKVYSRYGSTVLKQVYIYGGLDMSPTVLTRSYGLIWNCCGWLLTSFLMKIGMEANMAMRTRVMAELKTTFASHYTREISLAEALDLEILAAYNKRATGEKYLINPAKA